MPRVIKKKYTFKLELDSENTISASGNYRIFTVEDTMLNVINISKIVDVVKVSEDIEDKSFLDNLKKYVRYSKDGSVWSMWYDFTNIDFEDPANIISTLEFDPDDEFYISFKYEYNNNEDFDEIDTITIESIETQLTLRDVKIPLALNAKVNASCSPESCPEALFDRNSKLDLYDIGNLGDVYLSMSYSTQLLAGLPVLYFQTAPEESGTDYVFREYTLYNVIQRKCVKGVVNGNKFPDASFIYNSTDMNYQGPFEIHFDRKYFEAMFGTGKEPRKKDFLYLPIMNRMYEVQDVEMVRGLMMMPVYWKLSLIKFQPNINYLQSQEEAEFLDNMILDSEEQFGKESKEQIADATMSEQFSTASKKKDEVRTYLDRAVVVGEEEVNYNYTRMIYYYYNMKATGYENENCVIYDQPTEISAGNDATFSFDFKIQDVSDKNIVILSSTKHDSMFEIGLNIGKYINNKYQKAYLYIKINGLLQKVALDNILQKDTWYGVIIGVSPTYKQLEMYVYSLVSDEFDGNVTGFKRENSLLLPIPAEEISINESEDTFCLKAGDYFISNVRIFNINMPIEKHEFILSQLFIKDESMLNVIDNCRPQLGMPYLMKKY